MSAETALRALEFAVFALEKERRSVDDLVYEAREDGASWELIGKALGISRQAAHEKYAHRI